MTPMMVYGRPPSRTDPPTAARDPSKCRNHTPWLNMTVDASPLVSFDEVSTCRGRYTEDTEVLRGDPQVANVLRTGRRRQRQPGAAAGGGQAAERGGVVGQERAGDAIVGDPVSRSGRLEPRDRDETIGLRVGQRPHEGGVGDTEDGGRRGHAERYDEQTAQGETGIPPQAARTETEVLGQLVDQSQAARLPARVLHARDAAEMHPRAARRVRSRHPGLDQVIDVGLEVKPHLLVERVLETLAPEPRFQERSQAREHVTPPRVTDERRCAAGGVSQSSYKRSAFILDTQGERLQPHAVKGRVSDRAGRPYRRRTRSIAVGILPLLALLSGRFANLGATRGSATGCEGLP